MPPKKIPTDFPRTFGRGAIGGAQPKVLLRRENEELVTGMSEQELANRYDYCDDLANQLNDYCQRKIHENPDWSIEFVVERTERGLQQKISSGEWPILSHEEVRWIMHRVLAYQEERAAVHRTREKLLTMLSWYTVDQLGRLGDEGSRVTIGKLPEWEREGKIFSVKNLDQVLYARFQFDEKLRPIPVIQKVLELLKAADGWAIAAWFAFPNGWISVLRNGEMVPAAPVDALDRQDDILIAAKNSQGTYFA